MKLFSSFSAGAGFAQLAVVLVAGLVSSACSTVPEPIVRQPMTATPPSALPQREMNGAIFQNASYRPLFEDARARLVGDTLTISISENTSAGKTAASSGSKSGSVSIGAPSLLGLPSSITSRASASSTGSNQYSDKGAQTSSNTFNGVIAVTVIDVMSNGNLMVSGEKQLGFDKGAEYVRFSGVINPRTIAAGNVVASTQVADARFEYRSTTKVDKAEINSMLNRFFLSFVPL
ncbi:flagellar basal body L-ring protein FlgH [Undibacterium sp. TJN25]|uniref:flagellar basal body L-ring protein FlgH n=1 Tax=Undibacterium sp. TJN25 TaxID=3413056 RepID=UPI003BF42E91